MRCHSDLEVEHLGRKLDMWFLSWGVEEVCLVWRYRIEKDGGRDIIFVSIRYLCARHLVCKLFYSFTVL